MWGGQEKITQRVKKCCWRQDGVLEQVFKQEADNIGDGRLRDS